MAKYRPAPSKKTAVKTQATTLPNLDLTKWIPLLLLGAFISFIIYIRYRFLGIALERDEGEFAYMAQLVMKGIPLYDNAYNMKLPGIYYVYALMMSIFGETKQGIHTGLMVANIASIIGIFCLGKELFKSAYGALVAAVVYGIMTALYIYLGTAAHATQFVVVFGIWGLYLLERYTVNQKKTFLYFAGLLLGAAFTMKQPGLVYAGFAFLYLFYNDFIVLKKGFKSLLISGSILFAGVATPFLSFCLGYIASGTFSGFWFWSVTAPRLYASVIPFEAGIQGLRDIFKAMYAATPVFFWMALGGILSCLFIKGYRKQALYTILFFVVTFLGTTPGFYFRSHYFIVWLPSVALLVGSFIHIVILLTNRFGAWFKFIPLLIFAFILSSVISKNKFFLLELKKDFASHAIYGNNPFPEAEQVANYIKQNSNPDDKIAVLGSEAEILFLSQRQSATGYIYAYSLVDGKPHSSEFQKKMIAEIEKNKPKFIVFANVQFSWLVQKGADMHIFDWMNEYTRQYYNTEGVVDLMPNFASEYHWGAELQGYQPKAKETLVIFKRKA